MGRGGGGVACALAVSLRGRERADSQCCAGQIEPDDAKAAWQRIVAIEISLHGLTDGPAVISVARKLKRESAYDAAYIVLAQELDGELWTLDRPLANNAASVDLPVRLIDRPAPAA